MTLEPPAADDQDSFDDMDLATERELERVKMSDPQLKQLKAQITAYTMLVHQQALLPHIIEAVQAGGVVRQRAPEDGVRHMETLPEHEEEGGGGVFICNTNQKC